MHLMGRIASPACGRGKTSSQTRLVLLCSPVPNGGRGVGGEGCATLELLLASTDLLCNTGFSIKSESMPAERPHNRAASRHLEHSQPRPCNFERCIDLEIAAQHSQPDDLIAVSQIRAELSDVFTVVRDRTTDGREC